MAYNITEEQLNQAEKFFNSKPDHVLATYASEMNKKLPYIAANIMSLEKRQILTEGVVELMIIILTIWYVYAHLMGHEIRKFNNKALEKNAELFFKLIKYFNQEDDAGELSKIQYFKDPLLGNYLAKRIYMYFKSVDIPFEALAMLFSITKCLEDGLPNNTFKDKSANQSSVKPRRKRRRKRR